MEIRHPSQLSPEILVGIVNEKLRLQCPDKASLLYELGMQEAELDAKLAGFDYNPIINQYRSR
ncbi:DUF4250 domain-containing protein [Shewanella litorisediminis]|uniref:DUF4250 domain-containing protein n=1 Tax=Shewanella litorisediminis TaxID=1173586 RepID=A0ABX7FZI8_9GAMM|nr:DUF4250 domain-containing protein [Shewanella litorisediminis]MCL2919541.1 DUF4250 domain-containing protein [Shewanella litorisediminis]QRH00423.1 DUF4250 domain-containing protein [Shewanella litorisediminis]